MKKVEGVESALIVAQFCVVLERFSVYTKMYSMIYDSVSVSLKSHLLSS